MQFSLVLHYIVAEWFPECLIEPFGLPVGLRVIGSSGQVTKAKRTAHRFEEPREKLTLVIGKQV